MQEPEEKTKDSNKKKVEEAGIPIEETLQNPPDEPTSQAPFVKMLTASAQEPTDNPPFQKKKAKKPSEKTESQETKGQNE